MARGIDLLGLLTRVVPERPPQAVDLAKVERLLIVKLSSIGDVIHALPVASAFKRSRPSVRITWAIEQWTAPLVARHPAVDRVVVFPPMMRWPRRPLSWWRQYRASAAQLREEPYDLALDLQGLAKSAVITNVSRARVRIARAGQREGAHLVSRGVPMPEVPIHAVDEYLHVARSVGVREDSVDFGLAASEGARLRITAQLARLERPNDAPLIVVNASTAQRWKEWPRDRWSDALRQLARVGCVVMIGTSEQRAAHAAIADTAGQGVIDLTGQTSLEDVMALLERADVHVAADTGTVHMAVALGTPVVAIYGPTSPARVGPYGQPQSVIAAPRLCGPSCPRLCLKRRQCLASISVEDVVNRTLAHLGRRVTGTEL